MEPYVAWRNLRRSNERCGTPRHPAPSLDDLAPWVFPFARVRHERARALLGPDAADVFTRPVVTADIIDFQSREYVEACLAAGHDAWCAETASPRAVRALNRLADVEERHLVLVEGEPGHDTLTLAELAVTHRRQLVQRMPAAQGPLLAMSLILLTHQLHAAGRFSEAVATGQEAVDILTRMVRGHDDLDARPALVLALDVSLMTSLANGRLWDATQDLVRATDVLGALASDRAEHDDDLAEHLQILALTRGSADSDDIRGLLDHTSRWDVALREPHRPDTHALVRSSRTEADELYDDSVHLATSDGDGPAAAAAAGAAVAAYRRLLAGQPADHWHVTLRQLARALWRHAIVLGELLERPRDALGPGREAVSLTRRVLRVVERAEEFDELVGELGVTIHDLGTIALSAGRVGEHDQLVEEVARLDTTSVGTPAMRALGAALHNRAAEACETTVALAEHGRGMRATVHAGIRNSAHAVRVRTETVAGDDPTAQWELANSQLAHGHLRCLNGEGQQGAQAMADAYHTVLTLAGPAGRTMREAAEAALLAACAAYPGVTPRDDWPL